MGIAIRKEGFITAGTVTLAVVDDMLANGFKAIFPVDEDGVFVRPVAPNTEKFHVTLEATGTVDPLNKPETTKKQPWRINFTVTNNATLGVFVGSPTALKDDGSIPYTSAPVVDAQNGTFTRLVGARGVVGADYTPYRSVVPQTVPPYFASQALFQPHWNNPTEGFINRRTKVWLDVSSRPPSSSDVEMPPVQPVDPNKDVSSTYPLSYYLAITPRGIFLSIWQGASTNMSGTDMSWVLVQRPVHRDTGVVVIEGQAPVFCVSSVGNQINRFVVRESDLVDASAIASATADSKDVTAIINDKKQIGVSENNQYIVNYPSRLNTPRYAYTYELDMIGYTSATVVAASTEIPQTLYAEEDARTYIGMHANQKDNNGMRIVALLSGGGIDPIIP